MHKSGLRIGLPLSYPVEVGWCRYGVDHCIRYRGMARLVQAGWRRTEGLGRSAGDTEARLLKGFYGHALEAWLLVSVCAGLRRCESVGIEWSDLNLKRGTVTVKRSVQWVAGHETVTDPKTDQSRRTMALPRFAVKRLAQLKHGRSGRLVGDLNANQVASHYMAWCRRMKLPCVPPRNLRHTFGTLAIAAGADISVVARQLGHSDIKTTASYYLRPDLSVLKSLQRAWERLIIGVA